MGQGLSCIESHELGGLFTAVQNGEFETVEAMLEDEPSLLEQTTGHLKLSALHVAAANGRIEVLSMLLDRSMSPDILNRHKQTPLMFAAMHGKISCVERLIQAGANILMFDSLHGRTCLHYAAYYGHSDCLQAILSAAHSTPVAHSWGFSRFVNIRDGSGDTPLHLAAQQRRPECVHILLDSGALVCASTGGYGYLGSTPLHKAARGGSLDCVRELLAWGADRLQRDCSGRMPYMVAVKHKHEACAALLNPSSPEPLIWPSPLKFISELNPETKTLLEKALIEANKEREKAILKETIYSLPSPLHSDSGGCEDDSQIKGLSATYNQNHSGFSDIPLALRSSDPGKASDVELCCICFEQVCSIEVQTCGHQMCAHCTLSLCCHSKPNPSTSSQKVPVCPFCRGSIAKLVIAKVKVNDNINVEFSPSKARRSRKSFNYSEGSSSIKSLSAMGSFKMGRRSSGKLVTE